MKNLILFVLLLLGSFSSKELVGQLTASPGAYTQALTTIDQKIEQVYGTGFFKGNPELKTHFVNLLENRIKYVLEPQQQDEKYVHLSTVGLTNKYNTALVRDTAYNEHKFNPLKYQMEFWTNKTQVYRIDPTMIIVIAPQL